MTKEYPYTFDSWKKGKCSEVRDVPIEEAEAEGYQSTYVKRFNYLRDRGWTYQFKRWVSPEPPHQTYGKIELAYGAQQLKEKLESSS